MRNNIPIPYKIFVDKIKLNAWNGKIETAQARLILSSYFRMPRERVSSILTELHRLGLIELNNHKFILVLVK